MRANQNDEKAELNSLKGQLEEANEADLMHKGDVARRHTPEMLGGGSMYEAHGETPCGVAPGLLLSAYPMVVLKPVHCVDTLSGFALS